MLAGTALALLAGWVFAQAEPDDKTAVDAAKTEQPSMVTAEAGSAGRFWVLRLKPGADLRGELEAFVERNHLQAAAVVTVVGSLDGAALRFADMRETALISGKLEIVSFTGTLGVNGVHLHMSVSDGSGRTVGGHVQPGCKVRTTAEIVLVELSDLKFERSEDPLTGYRELFVHPRD